MSQFCVCVWFLLLVHMKHLYLLQSQWEGSYVVISSEDVSCRDSKQAQSRSAEQHCWLELRLLGVFSREF